MFCSQCGTEAQATAKFCQKCGTPFTTHFLPTQPSEMAVEKAHAPKNHAAPEAVPVRPAPQPRPERTAEPVTHQESPAQALWKPSSKVGFWMPLVIMALSMKLVGALGSLIGYITYTAVRAKRGLWVSLAAAIIASVSTMLIAASILEASGILKSNQELPQANAVQQQAGNNSEIDRFLDSKGESGSVPIDPKLKPFHGQLDGEQPDARKSEAEGGNPYLDPNYDGTPWSGGDYTPKQ